MGEIGERDLGYFGANFGPGMVRCDFLGWGEEWELMNIFANFGFLEEFLVV